MRRVGLVVIGVGAAVVGLATPALAEPTPSPAASAVPGEVVCTVSDPKLVELSGIVATADGYVVENDSNDQASLMRVSFLDSACKLIKSVPYPTNNPARDPKDLALDSTGALWVADIGDNITSAERRDTIALWKVPSGNGVPVIHRMKYPDGPNDAEALLFGPNDVPVIVTKDAGGTARLYQPSGPLQANVKAGVGLTQVGTFKPTRTGTSNLLGASGNIVVTGAATSPDRKRLVLRTYSDAYEWDVTGGDVVAAITKGTPRITPLPGEPLGEGITYSADGKSFLTCSDQAGPSKILRYRPAVGSAAVAGATTGTKPKNAADSKPWYKRLTLPQIINLVAALGVLGLVLVVVGVLGIQLSRRARRKEAGEGKPPADDDAGAAGAPVPVNSSAAPVVA